MDLTYRCRQVPGGPDRLKDQRGVEVKKAAGYTSLEIIPREQNLPFPTFDSAPSQKENPFSGFRWNIWCVGGQNG